MRVSLKQAVALLNGIHELDPTVLPALIEYRVPCNQELAEHPTVQVGVKDGGWEVGILGILNGLFGTMKDGHGYITAELLRDGEEGETVALHFRRVRQVK